ncbi:LANO_0F10924g1_1 [Lachancea nothofagi CBS 11611]|uniref:LANO_0F10924g1_1 n=1 Tax=Lachancea nothofagi CBS 11611 TaxID=1266666 RepID=A0A1G4KAL5_9SACH|nr:LANO_0F10924g1_1 [Lachancea nothofagi CBS 11611]
MTSLDFSALHDVSTVFSIANQALKLTSAEDIEPILENLAKVTKVTKLDFSGNTIGIEASRALSKFISDNASVKDHLLEINFADLYTSRLVDEVVESLTIFVPVWLQCPKLSIVNLSDNAFGLRTIDSLESYISQAAQLQHLILSNNGMGPFAGERIGKALYKLAQLKKSQGKSMLETFICGRNRLENGSATHLALGLKAHGSGLKTVRLYQNGIRPQGVAVLIKYGLYYNTNLQVLDLQDNTFTTSASLILAEILPVWRESLVELNVNDCLLKGPGSDAVIKVLTQYKFNNLHRLKLQYNELTQETFESSLLPALQSENLPALKFLELNGNRLEEDSDALNELEESFDGEVDELDDLEEIESDEEEEEEEEDGEGTNEELMSAAEIEAIEKTLTELQVEDLTNDLAKASI